MRRDKAADGSGFASPPFPAMGDGHSVMWNRCAAALPGGIAGGWCVWQPGWAGAGRLGLVARLLAVSCSSAQLVGSCRCQHGWRWQPFTPPPPGLACRSLSKEFYTSAADRYHACNNVTQALRKVGAKRLVVGHTPQMRGVNCECDGKVRLVVAAGRAGQQLWPQRGRARRVGVFLPFIHATGARLVVLVAGHCHLMTHAGPRLPSCRCGAWMWACPAACWTLRWVSWRSGRRPRARRMSPAESSR